MTPAVLRLCCLLSFYSLSQHPICFCAFTACLPLDDSFGVYFTMSNYGGTLCLFCEVQSHSKHHGCTVCYILLLILLRCSGNKTSRLNTRRFEGIVCMFTAPYPRVSCPSKGTLMQWAITQFYTASPVKSLMLNSAYTCLKGKAVLLAGETSHSELCTRRKLTNDISIILVDMAIPSHALVLWRSRSIHRLPGWAFIDFTMQWKYHKLN